MTSPLHSKQSLPVSKRKQLFHRRGFQLRFTALTACSLLILLLFASIHGLMMVQRVLSPEVLTPVWPELQSSVFRLLLVGLLYVGVVTLASMFLSHRAMGPLGRLEDEIKHMSENGMVEPFKVREGDDLEPTIKALNDLIRKVKGHR